jgi:hypothetical protein
VKKRQNFRGVADADHITVKEVVAGGVDVSVRDETPVNDALRADAHAERKLWRGAQVERPFTLAVVDAAVTSFKDGDHGTLDDHDDTVERSAHGVWLRAAGRVSEFEVETGGDRCERGHDAVCAPAVPGGPADRRHGDGAADEQDWFHGQLTGVARRGAR